MQSDDNDVVVVVDDDNSSFLNNDSLKCGVFTSFFSSEILWGGEEVMVGLIFVVGWF